MAVKGRKRFEILRRDNYTCRYCGASAPDVRLTVDHVLPVALGGTDDPTNLVVACTSCNGGKASVMPDSAVVADVQEDQLRWMSALQMAIDQRREQRETRSWECDEFAETWDAWTWRQGEERHSVPRAADWRISVGRWLDAGLELDELLEHVPVAMQNKIQGGHDRRWAYFCGIARNLVSDLHDAAHRIAMESGRTEGTPTPSSECAWCFKPFQARYCEDCLRFHPRLIDPRYELGWAPDFEEDFGPPLDDDPVDVSNVLPEIFRHLHEEPDGT